VRIRGGSACLILRQRRGSNATLLPVTFASPNLRKGVYYNVKSRIIGQTTFMAWRSITEEELSDQINEAWKRMTIPQRNLWEVIRINPEKWKQEPWGSKGNGFWVVAIIGKTVVWYNDIEDGFNRSTYATYGEISEYWCNQDQLEWTVQHILNEIGEGCPSGGKLGPPEPIP